MRFIVTICIAAVVCLIPASNAFALDDLGVVSGDTFELPGYNDGPSGGGVWPGSSGSGGEVGAMPLPNGAPDTGGSPHGGPGGGGGSGTGEGPKADQARPPYLSPKDRNTALAFTPFLLISNSCVSADKARTTAGSAHFALPLQGVRDGEEPPLSRRLEVYLMKEVMALDSAIKRFVEWGKVYSNAKASGASPEKLRGIAEELALRAFEASHAAMKVADQLSEYLKKAFSKGPKTAEECASDSEDRLARAELALSLSQLGVDLAASAKVLPDAIAALNAFGFADGVAWVHALKEAGLKIGNGVANFGIGFFKSFFTSWRNYYDSEITQLKHRVRAPGP